MATVEDIFVRVRDRLGDNDKSRWSDATLLRHLEDGLVDLAMKTKFFKEDYILGLVAGKHIYELPENCIATKSVLFDGEKLTISSTDVMDKEFGESWRLDSSETEVTRIVPNERNVTEFRVYPRPFLDAIGDRYTFDPSEYGFDESIEDYTSDSDYGILGSIIDSETLDSVVPTYGVLADIVEGASVVVTYIRHPIIPTTIEDDLEVGRNFNKCLISYIVAECLMADLDVANRQIGRDEQRTYVALVEEIQRISSINSFASSHHKTSYNGIG